MGKLNEDQKADARIHATVWENVFSECQKSADHRRDLNPDLMRTLATFALIVGGEYRRAANSGEFSE